MAKQVEIVSSTKNKIVIASNKGVFLHLKFSPTYSKVNALNLAILSQIVYKERDAVRDLVFEKNKPNGKDRICPYKLGPNTFSSFLTDCNEDMAAVVRSFDFINKPETETQFFHFRTGEYQLFSFRGTQEGSDWITNANSALVDFPEGKGKVHKGFYKAFKSIQKNLDEVMSKAAGKPVIVTGHSLGGALATLASAYIKDKYHSSIMLYTFGCPRVGDTDFVQHYSKAVNFHYFRVMNNEDLVPMVPPPGANLRVNLVPLALIEPWVLIPATVDPHGKPFTHFGRPVFIRRIAMDAVSVDVDRKQPYYIKVPGKLSGREDRPKWEKFMDWMPFSFADHGMEHYISILASDLRLAIGCYFDSLSQGQESIRKTIAYISKEIEALEKQRSALDREYLASLNIARADNTATKASRADQQTPVELLTSVTTAYLDKHVELLHQKSNLAAMSTPGYSQGVLKDIIGIPMTPSLKREFQYQRENIDY